ncbi:hypothetical protein V6C53_09315 [Desulfocurvibacter africanus]|uniref:TrlF family AAA-like ATPase n=1 Tax=Desulfocurvibacter africanus TaxID=873 RepID=UPI002FDA1991
MSLYPKGSEWRKWDLHVHSPASRCHDFSGKTDDEQWESYINRLESIKDVAVVGITDYFSIEGYKKVCEFKAAGRLKNIDMIIPNVELRLTTATNDCNSVNIHVMFDPIDEIIHNIDTLFFSNLRLMHRGDEYLCIRSDFIRLGRKIKNNDKLDEKAACNFAIEQFKVEFKTLVKSLKANKTLSGRYIIATPNKSNDGASGVRDGGFKVLQEEIYRDSHIIFSGRPRDRSFFLGYEALSPEAIIASFGSLKPCLHGSDAHSLDKICEPDMQRYTWIKADPTFEGLKQVLIEPEERVCIQATDPKLEIPKTHFCHFDMQGKVFQEDKPSFCKSSIPLNANLVTIIGGRGAGKSLLLDLIHNTFKKPSQSMSILKNRLLKIDTTDFKINLDKGDGDILNYLHCDRPHSYDYLHVSQGEVKDVAEDRSKLAEAVRRLLGIAIHDMEGNQVNENMIIVLREYDDIKQWLDDKDENGDLANSRQAHTNKIKFFKEIIETLTTAKTKEAISEFSNNTKIIEKLNYAIDEISIHKKKITGYKLAMDESIPVLNKLLKSQLAITITPLDFLPHIEEIDRILKIALDSKSKAIDSNQIMAQELASLGVTGDIIGILDKVGEYQKGIAISESKIEELNRKHDRLKSLQNERTTLINIVCNSLEDQRNSIGQKFNMLMAGKPGATAEHTLILNELLKSISIEGKLHFDAEIFYNGLIDLFDGRKIRKDNVRLMFPLKSYEDWKDLVIGKPVINIPEEPLPLTIEEFVDDFDFIKVEQLAFYNYFYLAKNYSKYINIYPKIKYLDKTLDNLSVGQRGTFYICLKLATEAFLSPFIFDQPEDDLDNEFIVKELQPIFRRIKKHRQVIVVTHNANIVVNSDAEQVIIAENNGEVISFISGSLEDSHVKASVCRILEGGEAAFKNRELRYNFK